MHTEASSPSTLDLVLSLIEQRELGTHEYESLIPQHVLRTAIEQRYEIQRLPDALWRGSQERLIATEAVLHQFEISGLNPGAVDLEYWLGAEQPSLDGKSPLNLLVTGKYDEALMYAKQTAEQLISRLDQVSKGN